MWMRTIFVIAISLAPQAAAPWFGAWKLNLEKSTASSDRFKKVTSRIEPAGDGLKVTYDMVGTRGGLTHMEWTGKFDGRDYPVQGVDYVLTNAYTRVDDRSYEIVVKVDGVIAATARVVISPDGKTLTTVTWEKNVSTTTVYERQEQ